MAPRMRPFTRRPESKNDAKSLESNKNDTPPAPRMRPLNKRPKPKKDANPVGPRNKPIAAPPRMRPPTRRPEPSKKDAMLIEPDKKLAGPTQRMRPLTRRPDPPKKDTKSMKPDKKLAKATSRMRPLTRQSPPRKVIKPVEPKKRPTPPPPEPEPCRLLELPPEIRNMIYHFVAEMDFDSGEYLAPALSIPTKRQRNHSRAKRAREYVAFTHTCAQVRAEFVGFLPFWLQNAPRQILLEKLKDFVATYYPNKSDFVNAPKLLVIAWDHDSYSTDNKVVDLTLLLRLRTLYPTFRAVFRPHRIIEDDLPSAECRQCGHFMTSGGGSDCDHHKAKQDASSVILDEYDYTTILNTILANDNAAWLKTLRNDVKSSNINVLLQIDVPRQHVDIIIFFRDALSTRIALDRSRMHENSRAYLRTMGFFDMDAQMRQQCDFMVCIGCVYCRAEDFGTYSADEYDEYDEIEISGLDDGEDIADLG